MIYALINFNKLNLSTLNFNCLGFVHEKYQCKRTITIAANEKAKRILQNLELKGKKKSICCSIILLADACICQEHSRRPTAIVYAATGWLADLSITLGEEIKLAECSKCNVVATSTNKDNITPVQQDKKVTSCFQKFLSQTQQLEETIIDLRSDNTKLEGANTRLANSEGMANEQRATISALQAKGALLEEGLTLAGLDTTDPIALLENALEAYQERVNQVEDTNDPLNTHMHQLKMETTGLQGPVQHEETIIMDVHIRLPAIVHEASASLENSSWLSVPGLGNSRPLTPPQSSCSSRQDTPQRD
ncbi:hypothetical protein D6D20_07422 [Aureobasidium pullulans]|uniref:Uncharacterized protein n=1 Tax=Aureobasidium pullulans TaxID=5580 RepID=A0A4S8Z356_AURPU|nr:hypothetical protein D6D20_07422 [Aureobasidium pullulans]